jgi:hypothetical protein
VTDPLEFPTCDQRVIFTGEYVSGRQALGRSLVGLPSAAVALLRACKGDAFMANQFWMFHERGLRGRDWEEIRLALLKAKPRVPALYVIKLLEVRLAA